MIKREDVGEDTQSAWNLSSNDILQMGSLSTKATTQFLRGDIMGAFHTTTEIRTLLHTYLSGVEDKNLNELEIKIGRIWGLFNKLLRDNQVDDLSEMKHSQTKLRIFQAKKLHAIYVTKYRRYIREMQGKYGFLFGVKEDSSRMF